MHTVCVLDGQKYIDLKIMFKEMMHFHYNRPNKAMFQRMAVNYLYRIYM